MNEELIEQLGKLADKAHNYMHAGVLPLPDRIHKESLTYGMQEIRDELRDIVREYSDDDPWDEEE